MTTTAIATTRRNEFDDDADAPSGGMIEVASSREAQEVQAAMVIAKRFPRSVTTARKNILDACKRKRLAEQSQYSYPKGGQTVSGPSIRLAEVLAQNWGNIDFGIIELEQRDGESVMMAYALDRETNARCQKVFNVKHLRHTRNGQYALNDPREIYELTANQGSRRLRACILSIIPGDIVEEAQEECDRTMQGDNTSPLIDRLRIAVQMFEKFGVTLEMVEKRLGHKLEASTEIDGVTLKKILLSLRDNMASPADFFDMPKPANVAAGETVDRLKKHNGNSAPQQFANAPTSARREPDAPQPPTEPTPTAGAVADPDAQPEPPEDAPQMPEESGPEESPEDGGPGEYEPLRTSWAAAVRIMSLRAIDVDPDLFSAAINMYVVGIGKKKKEESISFENRKRLYIAIRDGKFDYSTGKIAVMA